MVKLKAFKEMYSEDEIKRILGDQGSEFSNEIDFEGFLRVSSSINSMYSQLISLFHLLLLIHELLEPH